jgi:hypothetical protein
VPGVPSTLEAEAVAQDVEQLRAAGLVAAALAADAGEQRHHRVDVVARPRGERAPVLPIVGVDALDVLETLPSLIATPSWTDRLGGS